MDGDRRPARYIIPENFIDEGRMLKGLFKTRNFFEGLAFAVCGLLPVLHFTSGPLEQRIPMIILICGPLWLLGYIGFNGDPASVALSSFESWAKNRNVMLYDNNARRLQETPLENYMDTDQLRDKMIDVLDVYRETRKTVAGRKIMIEGKTFEFAKDPDLADLYKEEEDVEKDIGEEGEELPVAPQPAHKSGKKRGSIFNRKEQGTTDEPTITEAGDIMLPPPSTSEAQEAPSPDDMQVPEAEPKQISECQTEDAADRSSVQIDATDVRDAMRDVIEEPVLVVDLDPKNDWGYKGGYREEGKNKKTETDSEYTVILSD